MQTLFDNSEEIRYLGWKQPFAEMMLHGKDETRSWPTKYRGLVLITASKTPYSQSAIKRIAGDVQYTRIMNYIEDRPLQLGKAIAVGRLFDCRKMLATDENKTFVKFNPELYVHRYTDIRPIEPIPITGAQGWRKLSPDFLSAIHFIPPESREAFWIKQPEAIPYCTCVKASRNNHAPTPYCNNCYGVFKR